MKYLKTFESLDEPKVGDYVYMRSSAISEEVKDLVNNSVGKITKITYEFNYEDVDKNGLIEYIDVKYNFPESILKKFGDKLNDRGFNPDQLVAFAPTIKELELKVAAKKYNIG